MALAGMARGWALQAAPDYREAAEVILGYTAANDVTARDIQRSDDQWTRAKGFDTACPLGPVIVTDLDPRDLAVQARVLLMDEPLANLDPPHQADWMQTVRALVARGTTVVSVLHELGMALAADELVVMQGGRVLMQGAGADAATHRAVEQVFDRRVAVHSLQGQWVALPL